MIDEQLECCLEEEVAYGCTPHDVLNALERLQIRLDQHKLDEPGEYRQTKPTASWHSSLSSSWKISMSLFRAPALDVAAVRQNAGETSEISNLKSEMEPRVLANAATPEGA